MILRVNAAKLIEPHALDITFSDNTRKIVNVEPLLTGPVFKRLRDPAFFALVKLDPVCGTVVWPNGADFAPEALYELAPMNDGVAE